MTRRSALVSVLVLGLMLALVGCRATPVTPQPPIVVASDLDNPPFAFVDSRGEPAGRDIEMMNELARR
ncbi:MAG: transporter substrate-binding domain-containing protein, partial [Planctomycetota bacterium]